MNAKNRRKNPRRFNLERLEHRRLLAGLLGEPSQYFWADIDHSAVPSSISTSVRSTDYRLTVLDSAAMQNQLGKAPLALSVQASNDNVLSIPTPNGTFERFQIFVNSIMAPELAAKFPEIQTYAGQGIDDPAATIRLDFTPQGFHAQVISQSRAYYVDPYSLQSSNYYAVYNKGSARVNTGFQELGVEDILSKLPEASYGPTANNGGVSYASKSGTQLRTYRLAMAATGEYTAFHGGTVALGQAAIVTAVNRVGGIYTTEATVAFQLVANNDKLVYTNANSDPYTNNDGFAMLGENQSNVDSVIGVANYDIGHVFSTGGGGVAALGSVGVDSIKAEGVTGSPSPVGDDFWVDYVAHEVGHQFGGNHTFNSNAGSCQGNRNTSTAYEPGSGVSIQAYAGICGSDDLQPHSIPYFHSVSLDEIIAHVDGTIPAVGVRTSTGNNIPAVNAGADYIIPANTPFVLTATGSDSNAGDGLTYDWQERDLGPSTTVSDADNGSSPLFRVWSPTSDPTRTFPRLSDLVSNTLSIGEQLPTTNRTMNFRVVVRDNRATGGGFDTDDMKITVVNTSSVFSVTTPNTAVTWEALKNQTVNWNVAGTTANGINAANVDISMSADGGLTYPFVLAKGVPNSGSAIVRIPNAPTALARIRVQGSNNIFFDISNVNFVVSPPTQTIDIDLGSSTSFTENAADLLIAPQASLTQSNISSYNGGTLEVAISNNYELGDSIDIASEGTAVGQVSTDPSGVVNFGGTTIGNYTGAGQSFVVTFNAAATDAAIVAVMQRISYTNTSDDPSPNARSVSALIDNGASGVSNSSTINISVIPINDAPIIGNATLASVNEDTNAPSGATVSSLVGSSFQDVDRNSSLAGIVVVANPENPSAGVWQYSLQGTAWQPIGQVSTNAGLVLAPQSRLRFKPAKDYFGNVPSLTYRGLDNTFVGTPGNLVDVTTASTTGPISLVGKSIATQVLSVNDSPTALVAAQSLTSTQDIAFSNVFPSNWFADVDDPSLTLNVRSESAATLPKWLTFDAVSGRLYGVPANSDVGFYDLVLVASDASGATASVKVRLEVINVNDPPTDINLESNPVGENVQGALIGTLSATDPDSADSVTWAISDSRFEVAGNLLYLKSNSSLDYEQGSDITITIRATDNGLMFVERQKVITVVDENEFSPSLFASSFDVLEGIASSSPVGTLSAPDSDIANVVRFRFVGTPPSLFTLDSLTGQIRLSQSASLDFEKQDKYQFFVEAYDDGLPQRATTASVNVRVIDGNEFDPIITSATILVSESQATSTPFYRVMATDGDARQSLRFELLPSEDRFSINPTTGELSLSQNGVFDFENNSSDSIVVIVKDSGTPSRSSQQTLSIKITDANDPPTAVRTAKASVLSNVSGIDLGEIFVTDQDVGQQYAIASLDDRFIVVAGHLLVASGMSVGDTDPILMQIPVTVSEVGQGERAYPLTISLTRTPNATPWQNSINPLDVDRSGDVGPLDVLALINAINNDLPSLAQPRPANSLSQPDYDVDGDGTLNPLDALAIINFINSKPPTGSEGESSSVLVSPIQAGIQSDAWLAAFSQLEEEQSTLRRKRG